MEMGRGAGPQKVERVLRERVRDNVRGKVCEEVREKVHDQPMETPVALKSPVKRGGQS
jgi:hypothetical protein